MYVFVYVFKYLYMYECMYVVRFNGYHWLRASKAGFTGQS